MWLSEWLNGLIITWLKNSGVLLYQHVGHNTLSSHGNQMGIYDSNINWTNNVFQITQDDGVKYMCNHQEIPWKDSKLIQEAELREFRITAFFFKKVTEIIACYQTTLSL